MIQTVGVKQFHAILKHWRRSPDTIPKKQWLTFDRGVFLVIDNNKGQCKVKEFYQVDDAIAYSKGELDP